MPNRQDPFDNLMNNTNEKKEYFFNQRQQGKKNAGYE